MRNKNEVEETFKRRCPECRKNITYISELYFNQLMKSPDAVCRTCARRGRPPTERMTTKFSDLKYIKADGTQVTDISVKQFSTLSGIPVPTIYKKLSSGIGRLQGWKVVR